MAYIAFFCFTSGIFFLCLAFLFFFLQENPQVYECSVCFTVQLLKLNFDTVPFWLQRRSFFVLIQDCNLLRF